MGRLCGDLNHLACKMQHAFGPPKLSHKIPLTFPALRKLKILKTYFQRLKRDMQQLVNDLELE